MEHRLMWTVVLWLNLVSIPVVSLAAQSDAPTVSECQSIQDDAARLACYDKIASRAPTSTDGKAMPRSQDAEQPVSSERRSDPPPQERPATTEKQADVPPEAADEPRTLTDEIGREAVRGGDERDLSVRGRVVNCKEGRSGKYVFYFDNDQVWRQKDNKRLWLKECKFDVTISKDFFGYVMLRDDDDRTVRIERIR